MFDRPLNVPVIVDYIAYGTLKPIETLEDELDVSAVAENLILSVMKGVHYSESQDFSMAENILEYVDNKAYREAIQDLYHTYGVEEPTIVGEA